MEFEIPKNGFIGDESNQCSILFTGLCLFIFFNEKSTFKFHQACTSLIGVTRSSFNFLLQRSDLNLANLDAFVGLKRLFLLESLCVTKCIYV